MRVFITGIGSGIGEALAKEYLKRGDEVYALGRYKPKTLENEDNLYFRRLDLFAHEKIEKELLELLPECIDIAILNAGMLGDIKDMSETSLYELKTVMDLNVWSNKVILDFFKNINIKQVVAISSGAAVNGSRGWSGYSISKAALNMLIKLYAREMSNTHLSALAPGLVATPMLGHILENIDEEKYPSVKRLKESPKLSPEESAKMLIETFVKLLKYESGEFHDVRRMD
ncbi:SDR family NAD(P)-dependent oxidoreductase [Nitrosophilus alvini]|uniref:SDR family NAD(P)-dependent oxidoreductase n=1 Tax=Nitrosophilus alvini TaxID=2714855 RepID=UPI00190C1A6B|nr:SDR family NAD(P)-dependent oxidoreductase [Nitrosophilus alvini]